MTGVDWMIVLALNGSVIGYGFYLARGTTTSEEWFLGGRMLPWWVVGLSMCATNVDNADLVSITGISYVEGLHILTVHTLGVTVAAVNRRCAIPVQSRRGRSRGDVVVPMPILHAREKIWSIVLCENQECGELLDSMQWYVYSTLNHLGELDPILILMRNVG